MTTAILIALVVLLTSWAVAGTLRLTGSDGYRLPHDRDRDRDAGRFA